MTRCATQSKSLSYTEDEGRPLEVAMQVEASNRLKLLWPKAMVVSVKEKVLLKDQVGARKTNKPEPLLKCR